MTSNPKPNREIDIVRSTHDTLEHKFVVRKWPETGTFQQYIRHLFAFGNDIYPIEDFEERRLSPPKIRASLQIPPPYVPLVVVENEFIKTQLIEIARDFIKFENHMADYFQNFGRLFKTSDVEQCLENVRQTIAKQQNTDPASVDIGHLGRYCGASLSTWQGPSLLGENSTYSPVFKDDDEYIKYLQDGHDVFYWDVIMDIFHDLRKGVKGERHATMMMNAITNTVVHVSAKYRYLHETHGLALTSSTNNLDVVVGGIQRRMHFLKSVLKANIPNPRDLDHILSVMLVSGKEIKEQVVFTGSTNSIGNKSGENTWYGIFACFIGSIMLAIIPGCVGFAKSWNSEETGDTNDADFFYLIQSSIVSTFGNLTTLMLFERSDLPSPYASVWTAVIVGTICNIVSIVIYPILMSGWSALFSFIGTVASASCVVISTYTAVLERKKGVKEKQD